MAEDGRLRGHGPGTRAVAPVTGKVLEVGIVLLYVGLVSTTMYGGVVPGYQAAAGDGVAERTLASATQRVQQAVPPNATHVEARATVELPATIDGRAYAVRADGHRLVLDHPDPERDASAPLALPEGVDVVAGTWSSTAPAVVVVEGTDRGLVVTLEEGRR